MHRKLKERGAEFSEQSYDIQITDQEEIEKKPSNGSPELIYINFFKFNQKVIQVSFLHFYR